MVNIVIKLDQIMINSVEQDILAKIQSKNFFEKIIYEQDSNYNKIQVVENSLGRFLAFDNLTQAGIINHELYSGNIPYINYFFISYLLNPNIKNVLMLGMGTGKFAASLEELIPNLEKFDIVDIDEQVSSVAKNYFEFKENSKIKVHIDNAINFVENSKTKYDLIIIDISSSSGLLYDFHTEEYLNKISSLLTENGILISNVMSSYEFNSDKNIIFKSILKTYKNVFNDIMIIPTIYGDHLFTKIFYDIEGKILDIINTLLFSSKNKISISKEELIKRAKELQQKSNVQDIEKLDKFAEDLLTDEINTDNFKPFRDEYKKDPGFNTENLKDYLVIQ